MTWALPEWTVLALIREEPRHGFAIAALTGAGGELGRVWQVPRPIVYRALGRLQEAQLVTPTAVESGPGPQRTRFAVTDAGRVAVEGWLAEPVAHVRDMRSHLLVKLALLDRSGTDPTSLLQRQRDVLEPIVEAVAAERARQDGFDAVVLAWRHSTAAAALAFLHEITPPRT